MRLHRNLFLIGFLVVTINAVFGREDGPSEDRNELSTIQPLRAEDPGNDLPTIRPRKLEISSIFEKNSELVSTTATTAVCNGEAVSLQGTSISNPVLVQSNNYPTNYSNDERCAYNLSVPANSEVIISIQSLDIECPFDTVLFSFSNNTSEINLCHLKLVQSFTLPLQSSEYTLRALFSSDNSVNFKGFQLHIWINPITTTTTTTPTTTTKTSLPAVCTCGRWSNAGNKDEGGRIVGGSVAAPHSIPYQVGLWMKYYGNPMCGGTLISPNYVLTAAHCVFGSPAILLKISVNDVNYDVFGDGENFIDVQSVIIHPSYIGYKEDFDYAILRLATPAPISNTVGIACLPPDVTESFAGKVMTISGWGLTSEGGTQSHELKVSNVTGLTNDACKKTYGSATITPNMICAGTANFDTDTCQGDSGGPLVATVANRVTLVGVTSFGDGCAKSPFPGVYARVTAQLPWILANTDAGACQN